METVVRTDAVHVVRHDDGSFEAFLGTDDGRSISGTGRTAHEAVTGAQERRRALAGPGLCIANSDECVGEARKRFNGTADGGSWCDYHRAIDLMHQRIGERLEGGACFMARAGGCTDSGVFSFTRSPGASIPKCWGHAWDSCFRDALVGTDGYCAICGTAAEDNTPRRCITHPPRPLRENPNAKREDDDIEAFNQDMASGHFDYTPGGYRA